jgi:hypothetical protein
MKTGALSPGLKRQGRQPTAEVKNGGAKPPLPQMSSRHGCLITLINYNDNFIFLYERF